MSTTVPLTTSRAAAVKVFQSTSLRINQVQGNWDFALGNEIVDQLIAFLKKYSTALGQRRFGFELTQEDDANAPTLTVGKIVAENKQTPVLIKLGKKLGILAITPFNCDDSDASESDFSIASKNRVLAVFESASAVVFFANGFTVKVVNLRSPGSTPPRRGGRTFAVGDYQLAIREHYRRKIRHNWQETDHWEDRSKRVLRAKLGSRKTTEGIFHVSLICWLDDVLDDSIVRSTPRDVSSDETDIMIMSMGSRGAGPYLVELKWLGTNGATSYDRTRLRDGLNQLAEYLDKQPQIREATLLVYDGRVKNKFDSLACVETPEDGCRMIGECDGATLHARGSCIVLFLESTTASEA